MRAKVLKEILVALLVAGLIAFAGLNAKASVSTVGCSGPFEFSGKVLSSFPGSSKGVM